MNVPGLRPDRTRAACRACVAWLSVFVALAALPGCTDHAGETATSSGIPAASPDGSASLPGTADALRAALSPLDALDRVAGVARVLQATDRDELVSVRAVFEDPSIAPTLLEDAAFVAWWSRYDQRGPLEWTEDNRRSAGIYSVLFEGWGRVDPTEAASILAGQDLRGLSGVPEIFRNDATEGLLRGWYEGDKPGLFSYLTGLDTKHGGLTVLENFGRYLVSKQGAEGAIAFLASIPEDQQALKVKMLVALARPLTRASPKAGVDLFTQYRDAPEGRNLLINIAQGWVDARGGEAALEWVLEQQDHPRLRAATSTVFRRWIQVDQPAAMAWMQGRLTNVPPELEGALVVYIGLESRNDMLGALELRKKIRTGLVRRDVTLKLLRDWRRTDADAANAWIDEATTLSDYVRQQLAREKDKPQLGLQAKPHE